MEALGYISLGIGSYFFSIWSWNRCLAIAGKLNQEGKRVDASFGISVILIVYAIKTLF